MFLRWGFVPKCTSWEGWQGREVVSEAQAREGLGRGWHWGRPHTHQQAWAIDQTQIVIKGLLALLPGGWGLGCWDHQPQAQLLKVLVPGS